jgi:hypothetical protein
LILETTMTANSESKTSPRDQPPVLNKDWRFYTGLTALVLALLVPLLALGVPFLGLSTGISTVLIGGLVAGGPEVLVLVAAALLGKEVLYFFTQRVKQLLWEGKACRGGVRSGSPATPATSACSHAHS